MDNLSRKDALLKLIMDLGGEGTRQEINKKIEIGDYWELTEDDLVIKEKSKQPTFWHTSASICSGWASNNKYLLNDKDERLWRLTEKGENYLLKKLGLPAGESKLYDPFAKWLQEKGYSAIAFGNERLKQERRANPDVLGVNNNKEVVAAEIKISNYYNNLFEGLMQAISYKLFSHFQYLVIPKTKDIEKLTALARRTGVGLIVVNENKKFENILEATKDEPERNDYEFYKDRFEEIIKENDIIEKQEHSVECFYKNKKTQFFKNGNDRFVIKYSKEYKTSNIAYWYGISEVLYEQMREQKLTHVIFETENDGQIKLPISELDKYIKTANFTLLKEDVKQYQIYIKSDNGLRLYSSDREDIALEKYIKKTGE